MQELEELGDITAVQQYTYVRIEKLIDQVTNGGNFLIPPCHLQEIRMIQSKLRLVEETVCWVNEEEALFKFPQSSYQDVGDISVSGENK